MVRVIVTSDPSGSFLGECLASVKRETKCDYELTVVVDTPSDETLAVLDMYKVKNCLINDKHVGWAKMLNQGIKHKKADYYVLLTDRAIVTTGWLPHLLVGHLKQYRGMRSEVGLISPLLNSGFGLQGLIQCNTENYEEIQRIGREVAEHHKNCFATCLPLQGSCLLLSQQTIDRVGLFDENVVHADVDYSIRVLKEGMWVLVHLGVFVFVMDKEEDRKRLAGGIQYFNKKWDMQTR